jgi:general secretion pathway protein D
LKLASPIRLALGPDAAKPPKGFLPTLRSVNHDDLPNIYAQIDSPRHVVGAIILLLSGSLATRFAACLAAVIVVSGCASSGGVQSTFAVASKQTAEQSQAQDAFAFDQPVRSSAISLPSPASRAVAVTDRGDGRMIGEMPDHPRSSASADATVVLNLAGVPLQQAAKTVLGDLVGVNYVVDPRVDGVISVQTTRPVTKRDALELFQSALMPIGAVLVENRGIYRIVPADQSATGAISTGGDQRDVATGSDEKEVTGAITSGHAAHSGVVGGNGVRIVQLKYVSATEVARVLEPMVPKGSVVQADDARNILALKGSPGEIDSMLDTISIFDVDVMRGMSFAVVPVKTAQPEKLADELKAVFSSDKEGPLKGRVRFMANARLGAILVVTSQPKYLSKAQGWIKRLDAKVEGAERQLHVYQVQNRPVGELATILQSMFSEQIKVVRPASRNVAPRSRDASVSDNPASSSAAGTPSPGPGGQSGFGQNTAQNTAFGGGDLRSLARMPNNDGGSPTPDPMDSASPTNGSEEPTLKIVADDTKNSLLIMANDRDYQRILRVIQGLDVVPSQVMIEAVIAEVDLNDDLQYGVQWQLQKGGTPTATFSAAAAGGVASIFPGFNYAFNAANVAATLSALNSLTHVNIISTPSLMVLDNKTARLQVGDQVPITTQTATSTVTASTAIVNSITMQDTGVILSVTPHINESGRVQLEIEQEVSSVVPTTSSSIDSPTIQQRKVKTTVVVNNGEVLALGGMIQDSHSKTSTQIPILGSIPGIGAAFSNKDNAVKKTELVVLITPRVVRDGTENRLVTEEYRRKFREAYMPHESTREQTQAHTLQRLTGQ